jgi:prepilin-type N-terminal cleavage/methylation domain-containing protein
MSKTMKASAASERAFTLIELLVALIVLAILVGIAVPAYLGTRTRSADAAAKAGLRRVLPSIEAYYAENTTYLGMRVRTLRSTYDQSIERRKYTPSRTSRRRRIASRPRSTAGRGATPAPAAR